MEIISEGKAKCIIEPRGDSGLEGYSYDTEYKFEKCDRDKNGRVYIRVYPSMLEEESCRNDYYETCSLGVFNKYFQVTGEQSIVK